MKPQRIEISYKTIFFTIAALGLLAILWNIRSILLLIFICFIFMEAVNPTIVKLEKLKLPRSFAILLVYFVIVTLISFALAGIIPIMIEQTAGLISTLPNIVNNIQFWGFSVNSIDWSTQLKFLETLPGDIARLTVSVFSDLFSLFVVLFITFYMLLERKNISGYSFQLFGIQGREKTIKFLEILEKRLASWVNAEIILMTTIGLLSYLSYTLIGLNYAMPLAIIAGFLEAVPGLGPVIATIMAAIVGLTISPITAIFAIVAGIIIQQLENNIIVPKIMKEAVGLNPLVTILAIAVGAKLAGVLGAVLAVPVFLTFHALLIVIFDKKK